MSDLRFGEYVDITIKAAQVVEVRDGNRLVYSTLAGGAEVEHELHIGQGWPNHIVERVAPAEWPPQLGDVWRDRLGEPWFIYREPARSDYHGTLAGGALVAVPMRPTQYASPPKAERLLELMGPLTLVHRESTQAEEHTEDGEQQ